MRNGIFRKGLVFGIIMLFFGASIVSALNAHSLSIFPSAKLGNWLYVGGNGPGNYSTIQSAVDAANSGDTVFVYSGMYNESIVINTNQLNLIGQDKNTTIIHYNQTNITSQITINTNNCSLENLQIIVGNRTVHLQGISINSNYNIIKNNILINGTDGIELSVYAQSNTVIYNEIRDNLIGIVLLRSSYNNICHNVFSRNTLYNIYLSDLSDHNNISFNVVDTSEFGMRIRGSKYNNVYKNYIQNNQIGVYCC